MKTSPIAIVGQSCVLPGAFTPGQLWQAVVEGRDLLGTPPEGYWRVRPEHILASPESWTPDKTWSDRGGYVRGFEDVFDPDGFASGAEEILALDVQFHWVLHAGREVLRQAAGRQEGERAGLVLGNLAYPTFALTEYAEAVWREEAGQAGGCRPHPRNRFHTGSVAHVAAEALRLQAGAFALDAACASSLYAIKLACDRLHDSSADLMLAGGVNRADDLLIHIGFGALRALSRSGRSRPYHAEADGLVPAEGAALVALKRLADAEAAGDTILGVIHGVGLSNDGRRGGFLSPSAEGQARAMRRAYEQAGWDPRSVSLVECHATGTQVGDSVEAQSLAEVFAGAADVPVGSLKSNLGHLITAAGAAGLLKVLAALQAGVRPPTRGDGSVRDEWSRAPLRVLHHAEPWQCDGPRRAAISAFGFGGTNAHLLVEEWQPRPASRFIAPSSPRSEANGSHREEAVAVIGVAVQAGGCADTDAFAELLFGLRPAGATSRIEEVVLDARSVCFPPRDLDGALRQQLLILKTALAAVAGRRLPDDTGVFVGMQCDAEIARRTARLRVPAWAEAEEKTHLDELPGDWLNRMRDAFAGPTDAAVVIGAMPNIPASRISTQLDVVGPGFTVSAEELSGIRALDIAARGLRTGEIDAAVVGAVDLCCEPVHTEAAAAVLPANRRTPGDAAVVLVLKRLADARRDGDPVYAILDGAADESASPLTLRLDAESPGLAPLLGHAHAASGLLLVAAAILALHRRLRPVPSGKQGVWPWLAGPRRAAVQVAALGGQLATVHLREDVEASPRLEQCPFTAIPRIHVYAGADRAAVLRALEQHEEGGEGPARLVLVASTAEELEGLATKARAALRGEGVVRDEAAGIFYRDRPLQGELAFLGNSAAAVYPAMGAGLLWAFHDLVDEIAQSAPEPPEVARWYRPDAPSPASAFEKLAGGSMLAAFHGLFCRQILGLRPQAALGLSSGEKDILFAAGAVGAETLHRQLEQVRRTGLMRTELVGDCAAARRAWGLQDEPPVDWTLWRVAAPVDQVRQALVGETHAHLAIIHTPTDVVLAGNRADCLRILDRLGRPPARESDDYRIVFHVPEVRQAESDFRACHTLPTTPLRGVRFYSSASGRPYELTSEGFTDAFLAQATATVDFPRLIRNAWDDGVRIFLEIGPHRLCSHWVSEILDSREHLAVALDTRSVPALRQAALAAAELLAAGVPVDYRAFNERMERCRAGAAPLVPATPAYPLRYPAHYPPVVLPPLPVKAEEVPMNENRETALQFQPMTPAPSLAPILESPLPPLPTTADVYEPAVVGAGDRSTDSASGPLLLHAAFRQQRLVFEDFLRRQQAAQEQFLTLRTNALRFLAPRDSAAPRRPRRKRTRSEIPHLPEESVSQRPEQPTPPPPAEPLPLPPEDDASRKPLFERRQLEILAAGNISGVFGPLFEQQDGYRRQVRLPTPPLLLVDRVTGIDAEPGVLGQGTIWTETDVRKDSWYLHHGVMPAGLMIEAGQADLTLISWMGVDFENRGERVYRLLGCDLTYHGGLARPGDTLRYAIHIDGHARQGDVRLFFFHYDCRVGDRLRMTVRNGQAGFFTDQELAESGGVLWSADTGEHSTQGPLDPPSVANGRTAFGAERLADYYAGRAAECFGPGYERLHTHTRTPLAAGPSLRLLDEVTHCESHGGPWQRGYLRACKTITPQDWFFEGHFKDDPCMPGTLMFEGALQAMDFYLTWMGFTLDKDGWRFEPVPEETYRMRCRGQVTPASRELVYELFVEEVRGGREPVLYADVLCTVDGLKAFHCRRLGVRLVPEWPMDSLQELQDALAAAAKDSRPFAVCDDVRGDGRAILACALGRPTDAFGEMYRRFEGPGRLPRLPSPPYLFLSRVTRMEAERGTPRVGAAVEAEYDVPPDAWYFQGPGSTMPFAVLLEAALQPPGWLSAFLGFAADPANDLYFRNLDGHGTVDLAVTAETGTLRTRAVLTGFSQFGGLLIVSYEITTFTGDRQVCRFQTSYGFFSPESLAKQVGLPPSPPERIAFDEPCDFHVDLTAQPERYFGGSLKLPDGQRRMIDRVTGWWPERGRAGLGRLRSEQTVDPSAWYFKAHFFQDPVQPGSLGLEAMLQLLEFYMIERGMGADIPHPVFEPMTVGQPTTWKYRGQVVFRNAKVHVEMEVVEVGRDERGPYVRADAWLWVDGLRIYHAQGLGMRIVSASTALHQPEPVEEFVLDPEVDVWLEDHRPTFTVPVAPMTWMIERMAQGASRQRTGARVLRVEDARAHRWLVCERTQRLRVEARPLPREASGDQPFETVLSVWREASPAILSRFETVATARVVLGDHYSEAGVSTGVTDEGEEVTLPYWTGGMSHGPAWQLMRSLRLGAAGASAEFDAAGGAVPVGLLHPALLDGMWQVVPIRHLLHWAPQVPPDVVPLPSAVERMEFFGPTPNDGPVTLTTHYQEYDPSTRRVWFALKMQASGRVWMRARVALRLFPLGPITAASEAERAAFLGGRQAVPGLALSRHEQGVTRLSTSVVKAMDWLPGSVAHAYAAEGDLVSLTRQVAMKEHMASRLGVHPSAVVVGEDGNSALWPACPEATWRLRVEIEGEEWVVSDA